MSMKLDDVVTALQDLAPLELAAAWDNVGLLVEPVRSRRIKRVMLTIDLTDAVADEAVEAAAEMVIAYHPPIFSPVRRVGDLNRAVRTVMEKRIAVYSPHTALDAAPDGMSDWLAGACGQLEWAEPIEQATQHDAAQACKLVVFVPAEHVDAVREALATEAGGVGGIGNYTHCSFNTQGLGTFKGGAGSNPAYGQRGRLERVDEVRLEMACGKSALAQALEVIRRVHPYEEPAWEAYELLDAPVPGGGMGRIAALKRPATVNTIVGRIKQQLGLKHVRVARPEGLRGKIAHVAVCPGAGGGVFEDLVGPQLLLTGEMKHHDVLACVERGTAVVLTDHTHTERGYLPTVKRRLAKALGPGVDIRLARRDRDPLNVA
ncbi:MAG: Nif3-like dinuclear metal center hexameric protein [Alphaproteobacteria bacterium]|jgi:dinuclear metal center YbgI/SA1388 family protein|nr:Nif3-like dinuclear metal center hexameric protein [Alphaproteobacteria bacterium]